jgi:hypothetical protein
MPAAAVKLAILEVAMVPHSSAAQIVVFQGCQGTASIWWVDKARGTQIRPASILASAQIYPHKRHCGQRSRFEQPMVIA